MPSALNRNIATRAIVSPLSRKNVFIAAVSPIPVSAVGLDLFDRNRPRLFNEAGTIELDQRIVGLVSELHMHG